VLVLGVLVLSACSTPFTSADSADSTTPPRTGSCRDLDAGDLDATSNSSAVVPCSHRHTAQTFLVGTLPRSTGSAYNDARQGTYADAACAQGFATYLGADAGQVLQAWLSWSWFGPSEHGWQRGARWFRCDVIGGPSGVKTLDALPESAAGLFSPTPPDAWLTCSQGAEVVGGTKVACSQPHTWRAATTVEIGKPAASYPGDHSVGVRSQERCHDSIGSYLHHPASFGFAVTSFGADRWAAGNRLSLCWARTSL
jgi:hypothetical protein